MGRRREEGELEFRELENRDRRRQEEERWGKMEKFKIQ